MVHIEKRLGKARIGLDGADLVAGTGCMSRSWRWTGAGFLTTGLEAEDGTCWRRGEPGNNDNADWLLPVVEGTNPPGRLAGHDILLSDDEGFTSRHLAFVAEIEYPEACLAVRFQVWAYPGAPGLRTQLHVKALPGYIWDGDRSQHETSDESLTVARLSRGYQRHDSLPFSLAKTRRRMIGYFADTQNRNDPWLDILLEAEDERPLDFPYTCEWASAACLERGDWGMAMVKESHKCVNQSGVDTGLFNFIPARGLASHGWGIRPGEIDDRWRPAWATWCLVYRTEERARLRAFKTFDRLRYPLTERDMYVQANTWGSSQGHKQHRDAAGEANVLRELASCADLGIDVLQIDDGWQGDQYDEWKPVPPRYPAGWTTVTQRAAELGVKLGLWMAALPPGLEDMQRNIREAGFVSLKLDFAVLRRREEIDDLMHKVRSLVLGCGHKLRVNWDLTEVCPRYGYFFAREFGCIYLENRKPKVPVSVTYRPGTVLRDLWQISRYCNLLKFQGSVQNIDMVNPEFSDARAYSHAYCVAITLMSTPLFFCETHFYDDEARRQIRPLLAAYKKVRHDIYQGIVHPIGDRPNGASWTGFECELPGQSRGFFTLFREPGSAESSYYYRLPHLSGQTLQLEDLLTGHCHVVQVADTGDLPMTIDAAADFRFLAYRCRSVAQ